MVPFYERKSYKVEYGEKAITGLYWKNGDEFSIIITFR